MTSVRRLSVLISCFAASILLILGLVQTASPAGDVSLFHSLRRSSSTTKSAIRSIRCQDGDTTPAENASVAILSGNSPEHTWIPTHLVLRSDKLEIWLENSLSIDRDTLDHIEAAFTDQTMPVLEAIFPEQADLVGRNHPVRVAICNLENDVGYFTTQSIANAPPDALAVPIILDHGSIPGTPAFDSLLAHETGHYLEWLTDADDDTWVQEGLSILIEDLCGYVSTQQSAIASSYPADTQLNTWTATNALDHYRVAYTFMRYIHDRYGISAVREIASSPENGLAGIFDGLTQCGIQDGERELMADWGVANIAFTLAMQEPAYQTLEPGGITIETLPISSVAHSQETAQYATDYYHIDCDTSVILSLDLDSKTALMPTPPVPHPVWWSGNGDRQTTWLEVELDLAQTLEPRLEFDLWHDLETEWDWAYVLVTNKDAERWKALETEHMFGTSYETGWPGYTGLSGAGGEWIYETVDLDAFRGQEIRLRIQCQTDDAVHLRGIALTNMSLNGQPLHLDGTATNLVWHSQGFQLVQTEVDQQYVVQLVYPGTQIVTRVPIQDESNQIVITPQYGGTAILAISPIARWTTYPSEYALRLEYLN